MHPTIAIIAVTLLQAWKVHAFVAYDCMHPNTTYTVLDLTEPAPCADPVKDFDEPANQTVQVLMTDNLLPMQGYQCRVTISKEVTRCGFDSMVYGHQWVAWAKQHEVTPDECRKAVQLGTITIDYKSYDVVPGKMLTHIFFSYGKVHPDGTCETTTFWSEGNLHERSYEQTTLTLDVGVIRGTVDLQDGSVTFANGIRAAYRDTMIRDAYEGTIVWQPEEPECSETVSQVYLGDSRLHRKKGKEIQGSILMVRNPQDRQFIGLVLKDPLSLCGARCHATQLKGVIACLMRDLEAPIPEHSFKAAFDPKATHVQTQLSYLHLNTNMRTYQRFEVMQADMCRLERSGLHARLQSIAGSSNPYALSDIIGKGHMVYGGGAAAYLARCQPVEATKAEFRNCTIEIPVSVNGTLQFADPFLATLKEFPTVVPCSSMMPVRWKISGRWYCASPKTHLCDQPKQLNTTVTTYVSLGDMTEGLDGGMFTPKQMAQRRAFTVSQTSRDAVVSMLVNSATKNTKGQGELGSFISPVELESIEDAVGYLFVPFFGFFGEWWSVFLGFCFVACFAKTIIGCIIRAYVLVLENGFGWWILGALWHTVYAIIRAPPEVIKAAVDQVVKPLADLDSKQRKAAAEAADKTAPRTPPSAPEDKPSGPPSDPPPRPADPPRRSEEPKRKHSRWAFSTYSYRDLRDRLDRHREEAEEEDREERDADLEAARYASLQHPRRSPRLPFHRAASFSTQTETEAPPRPYRAPPRYDDGTRDPEDQDDPDDRC